jgi:glucosamine--fructose-6-phosphate aminotransferase (isomerizing)
MCGIIGYIGNKDVVPILLNGLKRLEYRGYDSAGLCVVDSQNNTSEELKIVKQKGRIANLEAHEDIPKLKGNFGIAHTRWATHGVPNEINAHPHVDSDFDIAIVHNGIIENHNSLREILKDEGHKIRTQTDSELVAHLVKKFYKGNLEDAVMKTLEVVEGTFGLAIVHKNHDEILVARKGSPLVIGVGEGEMFVASDVSAILEHTRKVVYLNDDEIAIIKRSGYEVKHLNGKHIDKTVHEIKWSLDQIEKKGYKHFMLKEIFEQPQAIANTMRGRLKDGKIKLDVDIDLEQTKRIIITSCGTSWHSALIGKTLIEKLTGIPVEVDYASEFRYRDPLVTSEDLLILVSQSGESLDTLEALREGKRKGAKTFGIVNVVGSTIARETDTGVYLHAGPEIGVASTKAFTTQVLDLLLVALYIRQKQGKELDSELLRDIELLPEKIELILEQNEKIRELAKEIKDFNNLLYLGRGMNFPVALEGALKLKEISYIHAEGYPAAEMKHGPIALIDKNMPVVFISPKDGTYEKILSNMEEIKARGGSIIALINEKDEHIEAKTDYLIKVPKSSDELSAIINTIPLQLLAYHVADLKGLDVDKPRNLAKSVTVE